MMHRLTLRKSRNKKDEKDYPQHVLRCGVVECQSEIVDVCLEGFNLGVSERFYVLTG